MVFIIAGMETTAITMSCVIWLLLKHPEISQKVVCEVRVFEKKRKKKCLSAVILNFEHFGNHCVVVPAQYFNFLLHVLLCGSPAFATH